MSYLEGHVKHDPATNSVAVRTIFPDDDSYAESAWQVVSSNRGTVFSPTSKVESWSDLYVPPLPTVVDPSAPPTGPAVDPGGS